eukprot:scaffold31888_cov84-Isochrysis_galbana.AAC.1
MGRGPRVRFRHGLLRWLPLVRSGLFLRQRGAAGGRVHAGTRGGGVLPIWAATRLTITVRVGRAIQTTTAGGERAPGLCENKNKNKTSPGRAKTILRPGRCENKTRNRPVREEKPNSDSAKTQSAAWAE